MREMGSLLVQVLVIAECLRSVAAVRLHQRACGGDARVVLPPPPLAMSVWWFEKRGVYQSTVSHFTHSLLSPRWIPAFQTHLRVVPHAPPRWLLGA
jgi:hypothetical protein